MCFNQSSLWEKDKKNMMNGQNFIGMKDDGALHRFMIDYNGVEDRYLCGFLMEADFPDETRWGGACSPSLIDQLLPPV